MKVDNPTFDYGEGEVRCIECPLDEFGNRFCAAWMAEHRIYGENEAGACPNAETYDEACNLADEMR